jgi:DNA-binding NtrC family response regulator
MKVLIVDDEIMYLIFLKRYLRIHDIDTDIESNPIMAYAKVTIDDYDLVITDYNMPSMNGNDLLKAIKRVKPECKVVIHSSLITNQVIEQANKNGAFGVIEKNENRLVEMINLIKISV